MRTRMLASALSAGLAVTGLAVIGTGGSAAAAASRAAASRAAAPPAVTPVAGRLAPFISRTRAIGRPVARLAPRPPGSRDP